MSETPSDLGSAEALKKLADFISYVGGDCPRSLEVSSIGPYRVPFRRLTYARDVGDIERSVDFAVSHFLREDGIWSPNGLRFRGFALERLEYLQRVGIDADPPDGTIYAADNIPKALEYISDGREGILCVYDASHVVPTWVRIREGEAAVDHVLYPHEEVRDGVIFRYRGRPQDVKCFYSHWIPGNPWDALKAVFVLSTVP